jgi:uncharacterized membrane protein YagU involved in acid resistance
MEQWSARRAILIGGSIAGGLDILFAISFAYYNGVPPMRLLQTVASGVLGDAAYSGGWSAAALGLACHFLIAYLLASLYILASRRIALLTRHAFVAGVLFGIAVFLLMRLVVLPLSAFPHPVTFRPLATVLDLMSHMFFFGVPIALAARQASPLSRIAAPALEV